MLGYRYTIRIALKDDYKGNAIAFNNFTIVSPEMVTILSLMNNLI